MSHWEYIFELNCVFMDVIVFTKYLTEYIDENSMTTAMIMWLTDDYILFL